MTTGAFISRAWYYCSKHSLYTGWVLSRFAWSTYICAVCSLLMLQNFLSFTCDLSNACDKWSHFKSFNITGSSFSVLKTKTPLIWCKGLFMDNWQYNLNWQVQILFCWKCNTRLWEVIDVWYTICFKEWWKLYQT